MVHVPNLIPVTDLRHDAAGVLSRLGDEPVFITQRGRAAAVLVSIQAFQKSEHDRELLRLLARGEREIAEGRGVELNEVMAEADRLLGAEQR